MESWYYSEDSERQGPVDKMELVEKVKSGILRENVLVWCSGMKDWMPAENVEALKDFLNHETPPPLIHQPKTFQQGIEENAEPVEELTQSSTPSSPLPLVTGFNSGRWRRYFARIFDTLMFSALSGVILTQFLLKFSPATYHILFESSSSDMALGIIILPLALAVEAAFYSVFMTTPGKFMASLRVTDSFGHPIGGSDYFYRNCQILVYGLGFGIPLISLFTMAKQSSNLADTGYAGYDKGYMYQVIVVNPTKVKMAIYILVYLASFLLYSILMVNSREQDQKDKDQSEARSVEGKDPKSVVNVINEQLKSEARSLNETLPKKIDDETRLDKVSVGHLSLAYHYSLPNISIADLDKLVVIEAVAEIREGTLQEMCASQPVREVMAKEVTFVYDYIDMKGNEAFYFSIKEQDCLAEP